MMGRNFILMSLSLSLFLVVSPVGVIALPADMAYIKTLPIKPVKAHQDVFSFDEKGVDQMVMRHKELNYSQAGLVDASAFDAKAGVRNQYMSEHHWRRFQAWTPDTSFVSASMNAPAYFLGRRIVAYLGSPFGMLLSSAVLCGAIYLALMERVLPAIVVASFYLLWGAMPLLKLFTAWWA